MRLKKKVLGNKCKSNIFDISQDVYEPVKIHPNLSFSLHPSVRVKTHSAYRIVIVVYSCGIPRDQLRGHQYSTSVKVTD